MASTTARSPRVERARWGQIRLEDGSTYKDAKLFPGGSRAWDWDETGTRHAPGVQPADVQELIDHGADVVILSQGFQNRLQICPQTRQWLAQEDVEVHADATEAAVTRYNRLVDAGRAVGALIHSTC